MRSGVSGMISTSIWARTMAEGIIDLDTPRARELGFTSDKFEGYLWEERGRVLVSFIESREEGKGNLSRLFEAIWARGLRVAVPTPMGRMRYILAAKGFTARWENGCEVWER